MSASKPHHGGEGWGCIQCQVCLPARHLCRYRARGQGRSGRWPLRSAGRELGGPRLWLLSLQKEQVKLRQTFQSTLAQQCGVHTGPLSAKWPQASAPEGQWPAARGAAGAAGLCLAEFLAPLLSSRWLASCCAKAACVPALASRFPGWRARPGHPGQARRGLAGRRRCCMAWASPLTLQDGRRGRLQGMCVGECHCLPGVCWEMISKKHLLCELPGLGAHSIPEGLSLPLWETQGQGPSPAGVSVGFPCCRLEKHCCSGFASLAYSPWPVPGPSLDCPWLLRAATGYRARMCAGRRIPGEAQPCPPLEGPLHSGPPGGTWALHQAQPNPATHQLSPQGLPHRTHASKPLLVQNHSNSHRKWHNNMLNNTKYRISQEQGTVQPRPPVLEVTRVLSHGDRICPRVTGEGSQPPPSPVGCPPVSSAKSSNAWGAPRARWAFQGKSVAIHYV